VDDTVYKTKAILHQCFSTVTRTISSCMLRLDQNTGEYAPTCYKNCHQNQIPRDFPDIPARFLEIPDDASSIITLVVGSTFPTPTPFNANISSVRHIQYLQLSYLSK